MIKPKEYIIKEQMLSDLEYELITEMIRVRKEKGLSKQEIANRTGLIRETIARIENRYVSPQLDTVIKILNSMNCEIKIVEKKSE